MSRQEQIYQAIARALNPEHLLIQDETHQHSVPKGSETHFKVVAVSDRFANLNPIARHRLINTCLASEFETGLHALSLHLYTPDEWLKRSTPVPDSPLCQKRKKRG